MRPDPGKPHPPRAAATMRRRETSAQNDPHSRREPKRRIHAAHARRVARRLGPAERGLLAVILLAVGVTVAMAIFDPG